MRKLKSFNVHFLHNSLMESVLYGSYDLNSLLHNIYNRGNSGASKIANAIIRIMDSEKDIRTNYNGLGLTDDKNDEVTFIPDPQFQRSKQLHEDPWARQKSKAKIGRLVRQVLKDDGQTFTEKDIEDFVNSFKSFWDRKNGLHKKISIVSGDDILYWYNGRNYLTRSKGELGSSCMSGPNDNHYMEIYAKNPDKIRMVILTEDDKLIGRALLWNIDEDRSGDDIKFYLDRIYTAENSDVNYIQEWVFGELGEQVAYYDSDDEGFKVYLKNVDFDYYPYADTMSYLYKKIDESGKRIGGGFASNIYDEGGVDYVGFNMASTEGGLKAYTHHYSRRLKAWFRKNETVQDITGDYLPENDAVYSRDSGTYLYEEDAIFSKSMDSWILKTYSVDDPEFGIVSSRSIINVIKSYNGKETNPVIICKQLQEFDNNSDLFTSERGLKGQVDDIFRWNYSPNPKFIYFSSSLKVLDVSGNSLAKFAAFQVFERTNYKYSVKIGVYLNASIRSDNRFYNDDLFIINQEEYNNSTDKKGYLLSKLVTFVNSLNDGEKRRFDSREKPQPGKIKYSWDISPINHFKNFLKLKPVAILNIQNKSLDEWFNSEDNFVPRGWTYDEIYNSYSKENSLVKVIKQRFDNYKVFGPCTIAHNYYQDRTYTPYFYDEDGEYRMNKNEKQIIMETTMQIRLS